MSDIEIAERVSSWTGLGVELLKELTDAIAVYEALKYTEVGRVPVFDIEAVTPKNAEAAIRELADQLALSEVPGGGLSVLEKAKRQALDAAARAVRSRGTHSISDVIRQLTPEFDKHVELYTEAVAKLPEDITADSLISAGADAVAAFGDAQREARYLNRIDSWVAQTGDLVGIAPKFQETVIRILQPESITQLAKLDAAQTRLANPPLGSIDPVFYTAVREGIPFGINSSRQASALRTRLETPQLQKL
jgi:hypothetical protein